MKDHEELTEAINTIAKSVGWLVQGGMQQLVIRNAEYGLRFTCYMDSRLSPHDAIVIAAYAKAEAAKRGWYMAAHWALRKVNGKAVSVTLAPFDHMNAGSEAAAMIRGCAKALALDA